MSNQKKKYVWHTSMLRGTVHTFGFRDDNRHLTVDPAGTSKYLHGHQIVDGGLPSTLFIPKELEKINKRHLTDIIKAGNYVVVSQKAKDVFDRFDLGASRFSPVRLLKADGSAFKGDWFILNYAGQKRGFRPELSANFKSPFMEHHDWLGGVDFHTVDDDIKIDRSVLDGPDLWMDPSMHEALFITDPLLQALRAAKVVPKSLEVLRCPVVSGA